ncbi:MAG: tRNA (N6-isopentenyl adenosine(37)-C2)-methylthiotransferase MiaB [Clostridia bacterium]|nr:tRNA (N6-isopentenyl adenosine(37)-C2)-methylthiotransferase MiaB [Clostridia bacterium]
MIKQELDFDINSCRELCDAVKDKGLTYNIVTYGCAMNEHDSENISGVLENCGFKEGTFENADLILFNTCCVRDNAEHKLFGNIGVLKERKEENENLMLGVCGCMMQQKDYANNLKKRFPYVDIIFGTHNLANLPGMISDVINKKSVVQVFDTDGYIIEGLPVKRTESFSAFINIMFGCNHFCTYCIVPFVRGRERSRSSKNIIEEAKRLADDGVTQITLLGQNVNSYNVGTDDISFAELLDKLSEIEGIKRINYLTSHPKDLSDELIDVIKTRKNVSKHLHLPVQSGDNAVLKAMNRGYTVEHYVNLIEKIKKEVPGIGLTTDIIVGFPGETEEAFLNTLKLLEYAKYDGVFSFMYNVRKGTVAEKMENMIDAKIKRERLHRLIDVQNEISHKLYADLVGKEFEVLIDKKAKKEGQMCGRSMCGKLINVPCDESYLGKYVNVVIDRAHHNSLSGKLV